MALNVKIDFDNCYETEPLSADLSISKFNTELHDGNIIPLGVLTHPLLPDVYNLSFGPINTDGKVDDGARITHADHSKVFSTIIFTALAFLTNNTEKFLGIDGSNNARAYLYFRLIQNNYDLLTQYFDIYGVNYYVRVLRKIKDSDDNHPVDTQDIKAIPVVIKEKELLRSEKLYNYFIFRAKQEDKA